jgi:hypothetical protein
VVAAEMGKVTEHRETLEPQTQVVAVVVQVLLLPALLLPLEMAALASSSSGMLLLIKELLPSQHLAL